MSMKPLGWLKSLKLSTSVSLFAFTIGISSILFAIASTLYLKISTNVLEESKIKDTSTILRHSADDTSSRLASDLSALKRKLTDTGFEKSAHFDLEKKRFIAEKGFAKQKYTIQEFGIDPEISESELLVTTINGNLLVGKRSESTPTLYGFNAYKFGILINATIKHKEDSLVYIVNKNGKLLFSNDPIAVNETNLSDRPLIRKFAENPITSMQITLIDKLGQRSYGYFSAIAGTNLVLLSETKHAVITEKINAVRGKIVKLTIALNAALIFLLVMTLLPAKKAFDGLNNLVLHFIKGNFNQSGSSKIAFSEFANLLVSFKFLEKTLKNREDDLRQQQNKLIKSTFNAADDKTAKSLQTLFIHSNIESLPKELSVDHLLLSSSPVGGDWMSQFHDQDNNRFYVAIADVGADTSLRPLAAAAVSGHFYSYFHNKKNSLSALGYVESLNQFVTTVAKDRWFLRLMTLEFDLDHQKLHIINVGYQSPLVFHFEKNKAHFHPNLAKSSPLALESEFRHSVKEIELKEDMGFLLFSNGLNSLKKAGRPALSRHTLRKLINDHENNTSKRLLQNIKEEIEVCLGDSRPEDDLFIISIRYHR